MLPAIRAGGHTYHLLVQGGKGAACASCNGAALRLLNRDNLSGKGGPGHIGGDLATAVAPGGCEVLTAPAVWHSGKDTRVIYANGCGTAAYRVSVTTQGRFRLDRVWSTSSGGTTPVVARGTLWVASGGEIRAYRPKDGALLWRGGDISDVHWQYPLVVGKKLYIADSSSHVYAFNIGS
jgi:hypothetical protein